MQIKILGTGCAKCSKLAELGEAAAKEAGADYTLEKVTEIDKIIAYGVISTPALVVDGKVWCSGRVPAIDEIKKMLLS
ncbi:MAG: thioredoxin family protein [Phycisphaerales bacterium]|nr:thioredoxin family protein [Phycisphaerales bacterium]